MAGTDTIAASDLGGLAPNPDWASLPLFDRTGWKRVRFGDVVRMVKEQVDPVADGVERYVAGEHMETENVHIRKWGNVGEGYLGPAFIRRFRKGQVLYGSRRTYLKKVAVAEWDGVTANTTFVLESIEGKLLQELLPWLMFSERFTKHSIQESKGSTNPYINFPDIAKFEFDLPPLDQQRRIAEILWAIDETLTASEELSQATATAKHSFQCEALKSDSAAPGWDVTTLENVAARISVGLATSTTGAYRDTGVPLIRNQNIRPLYLDDRELLFLDPDFANQFENKKLKARDIVTTRTGANIGQTCLVPHRYAGAHSFTTLIVSCNESRLLPEYLVQHMNAPVGVREVERLGTCGGKGNLNVTALALYRIALPPLVEQGAVAQKLSAFDKSRTSIAENTDKLRSLIWELIGTLVD